MKDPEFYKGREQTFIKHYFLEYYLERVAYNILSFKSDFVFVDGFSGPWRSDDENYGDTSFAMAVDILSRIKEGYAARGKHVNLRCLFNEVKSRPFQELRNFCNRDHAIECIPYNSKFEDLVPEILKYVGNAFSLTFIDPTGTTGYPLESITPLLKLRGEVLINFMFDFANRFKGDEKASRDLGLADLYGMPNWLSEIESRILAGETPEEAMIGLYLDRLKEAGNYDYATSTRIKYPPAERTYFHLIYCTRSYKGIREFRAAEKQTNRRQEELRIFGRDKRIERETGQKSFLQELDEVVDPSTGDFRRQKKRSQILAEQRFIDYLRTSVTAEYKDISADVMQIPLVFKEDFDEIVAKFESEGRLEVRGKKARERTLKNHHILRYLDS